MHVNSCCPSRYFRNIKRERCRRKSGKRKEQKNENKEVGKRKEEEKCEEDTMKS